MAETFKIIRENSTIDALLKTLTETKDNVKDVFCAIRFTDGGLLLIDTDVPFETLCTISKKLDLIIDMRQQEDADDDDLFEDDDEETETEEDGE